MVHAQEGAAAVEVPLNTWWLRHLAHAFRFPATCLLMATVVLQYAGQALGTVLGGPLGAVIGRAAGAVAGSFIDQKLVRLAVANVQGAAPRRPAGHVLVRRRADIPRIWGAHAGCGPGDLGHASSRR